MFIVSPTVPSQPLNVIILPDSVTPSSFNVTWSPPSDINSPGVSYTLRLTSLSSPSRNVTGITEEMFTLEELMPFTNYTVVVVAVSERGPGLDSDSVSVTTDEDGKYIRALLSLYKFMSKAICSIEFEIIRER